MNATIYKILTADQWQELQRERESAGAPIDISDGFVHFSTAEQLQETADKHFQGQDSLVLLALDSCSGTSHYLWSMGATYFLCRLNMG